MFEHILWQWEVPAMQSLTGADATVTVTATAGALDGAVVTLRCADSRGQVTTAQYTVFAPAP